LNRVKPGRARRRANEFLEIQPLSTGSLVAEPGPYCVDLLDGLSERVLPDASILTLVDMP